MPYLAFLLSEQLLTSERFLPALSPAPRHDLLPAAPYLPGAVAAAELLSRI